MRPQLNSDTFGGRVTMHVIVSTQANRRWISGIFLDPIDAQACLASLQTDTAPRHSLEAIPPTAFPLFILEDRSRFTFLDPTDAARVVTSLPDPAPNAEPILFTILEECRPDVAGRDEMGRLRHVHLDRERLIELRKTGLLSLTT